MIGGILFVTLFYTGLTALFAIPAFLWGRHRQVTWQRWELLAAIGPGLLWILLGAVGGRVKSLSNLIELLAVSLFVGGISSLARVLITPSPRTRSLSIALLIAAHVLAVILYLSVPTLSE